jgi:hypothetical protein
MTSPNPTMIKDDQELLAKLGQLFENQLRIWNDFVQLNREYPENIVKIHDHLINKFKNGT